MTEEQKTTLIKIKDYLAVYPYRSYLKFENDYITINFENKLKEHSSNKQEHIVFGFTNRFKTTEDFNLLTKMFI